MSRQSLACWLTNYLPWQDCLATLPSDLQCSTDGAFLTVCETSGLSCTTSSVWESQLTPHHDKPVSISAASEIFDHQRWTVTKHQHCVTVLKEIFQIFVLYLSIFNFESLYLTQISVPSTPYILKTESLLESDCIWGITAYFLFHVTPSEAAEHSVTLTC